MEYLRAADATEIKETLNLIHENQIQKTIHRHHRNGFTNDRGRTMRKIASIPFWVTLEPKYAGYFHKDAPPEERKKDIRRFLRDHPEFLVVDKL